MNAQRQEGMALLLTLVFVVLLTVLVVEYGYDMQVETSLVAAEAGEFEALIAAKSAVATGMAALAEDLFQVVDDERYAGAAYDSLDEPWALGLPFETINESLMYCTIDDEWGKLNLNVLVSPETGEVNESVSNAVRALFQARGAESDPVDAIIDWIDMDDEERPNGAESTYYSALDIPYACKNGHIDSVEELLLIRGISLLLYFGDPEFEQLPLTELLTVHGHRQGKVNLNTAEYEVLGAVGAATGQLGLADLVMSERESNPFVSNEALQSRGVTTRADPATSPSQTQPQLMTVSSKSFRIRGYGLCRDNKARIDAYVWRDERPGTETFVLLDWRVVQ